MANSQRRQVSHQDQLTARNAGEGLFPGSQETGASMQRFKEAAVFADETRFSFLISPSGTAVKLAGRKATIGRSCHFRASVLPQLPPVQRNMGRFGGGKPAAFQVSALGLQARRSPCFEFVLNNAFLKASRHALSIGMQSIARTPEQRLVEARDSHIHQQKLFPSA
ncbi:hypothetical protein ACU8MT_01590 [Rhizobium leguminosarum]